MRLLKESPEFNGTGRGENFRPVCLCPECNLVMFEAANGKPTWDGKPNDKTYGKVEYCPECGFQFDVLCFDKVTQYSNCTTTQTITSWSQTVRVAAKPVWEFCDPEPAWWQFWLWMTPRKRVRKWEVRLQDQEQLVGPLEQLAGVALP